MKQLKNVWMLPLLIAAVFLGCPTPNDDYTVQKVAVELTAGTGVDVNADDTSASVTFAGANGLALAPADFTVTAGAVISNVSVNGGTATVTVGFAANSDTSIEKTYTVGIAPESTVIKGSATVTITQGYAGDIRRILQAGAAVTAAAGDTSAAVTFTGAAGLTIVGGDDNLEPADFTTSAGATVGAVSVTDDTATVTVSFAANTDTMVKTYAIGIAPNSTLIKGSGTVTVTQAAREVLNAYYVSFSTGNDENAGTEAAPWKTIARVNRQTFQAGDAILFKSGDTWTWDENTMTGKDFLAPQGSGTDGNPITISSYGAGDKPKLEGRGLVDNIIRLDNQQHWEISRLEISNMVEGWTNPMTQNNDQGTLIHEKDLRGIYITGDNGQVLNGFNMHDLYIHDITGQLYWIGGGAFIDNPQPVSSFPGMKNQTGWDASKRTGAIFAETFKGDGINPTTFNNITVENNVLERNSFSGFSVKQHHGGSGGVKWAFPGANEYPYNDSNFKPHTNITVRGNYIDQTGWYHGDGIYLTSVRNALVEKNVVKNPGVCGIELYYCDSITVQYNEVYGSTSKGGGDTNGIDPDVRTSNIIIQYNYVHDCGDGFLICGGQYNTVIIRYNVLYNNTRNWIRDVVNNGIIQVYNNILYNTKAQEETPGTMRFTGWRSANTNNERWEFKNNVFYNAHAGTTGTSFMTGNNSVYANNLYYGVTPPGTPSADSSPVAVTVDALFNGAVNFATGTSAAAVPNNFDFLKPAAGSPLINQGTAYTPEPTRIDAVPNGKDYAGAALSGKDDIGLFAADFKGLAGIVTDQIGGKVQGATVNVGQELSATTNTDGKFAFSSVPSGSYTVQVIKDQFAGSETPFEVNADAVSWLPLSVGEFTGGNVQKTVTGTVTSSGTALAGVTITIRKGTAEAGAGTTGADGRYSIANVTPDSGYTITASKDGYQTQSVSLILSLTSDPDPQNFDILPLVADPAASPASGSRLFKGDTITLSATTAGAAIYYTLNGSTPSDADAEGASILYTGPIQLSSFPITVKAAAFKTGYANSGVMTANYAEAHPVNITYTGLSANGVTLNWAALDGATGYEVSVYSADGEVATASPSGASAAISGAFTAGKNYYAKVRAKKNALVSGWGIARFKLGSSQAAWSENFETASTTDDLPWTLTSSGGNVAQTIADFYSGNKSGRYYFQGTGARHTRLGFSTPVTGNTIDFEFDWYPGKPNRDHGRIYVWDGTSGTTGSPTNLFITFGTTNSGEFYYFLGNHGTGLTLPSGAVTLSNIPAELQNSWLKVSVSIDSTAKKIGFEIVDTRDGAILERADNLDFASGVAYTNKVAGFWIVSTRPDGTNPTTGWITYLDNIAFYASQP